MRIMRADGQAGIYVTVKARRATAAQLRTKGRDNAARRIERDIQREVDMREVGRWRRKLTGSTS